MLAEVKVVALTVAILISVTPGTMPSGERVRGTELPPAKVIELLAVTPVRVAELTRPIVVVENQTIRPEDT